MAGCADYFGGMLATLRATVLTLTQPQKKLAIVAAGVLGVLCYAAGSMGSAGAGSGNGGAAVATFAASEKPVAGNSTPAVSLPQIYVALAGAVRHPGVYSLKSGARVFDAVFAAGGLTAKADQTSVNLARVVTDGEQIVVAKIGVGSSGVGSSSVGSSGPSSAGSLISLNQASETELEALPGVGPALAGRMVDWRTTNGGFKSKQDLLNVTGIGDKLYAAISKLVTL